MTVNMHEAKTNLLKGQVIFYEDFNSSNDEITMLFEGKI